MFLRYVRFVCLLEEFIASVDVIMQIGSLFCRKGIHCVVLALISCMSCGRYPESGQSCEKLAVGPTRL